jgi:hypothetical protein
MARLECKFQDASDEPALARLAKRLVETEYQSWPLSLTGTCQLPGAAEHDPFVVRRRRLLLRENGEVRALQNFFEHEIYVDGKAHRFVWPNAPLSEGIVNPRYAAAFLAVLTQSLKLQPLHLAMGGSPPLQKVLTRLGWKRTQNIGRFLLPVRPTKVLREMAWFQRTLTRRIMSRLLASSGLGSVLGYTLSGRKVRHHRLRDYRAELCDDFGPWADDLWREVMPTCAAVTRRDAATMNRLYHPHDSRFQRVLVSHRNRPVGWFLFTTCLRPTAELNLGFGNLRVAALVDTFGHFEHARPLLCLAVEQMVQENVDLIFGHWTHQGWTEALRDVGFLPTGAFPFFVSPAGADLLFTPTCPIEACHFTGGDCDGPYYVQAKNEPQRARVA